MDMHEVKKMMAQREHDQRYGHLSQKDRDSMAMYQYGGYPGEKDYHSPQDNFGGPEGVDPDSHGAELQ